MHIIRKLRNQSIFNSLGKTFYCYIRILKYNKNFTREIPKGPLRIQ